MDFCSIYRVSISSYSSLSYKMCLDYRTRLIVCNSHLIYYQLSLLYARIFNIVNFLGRFLVTVILCIFIVFIRPASSRKISIFFSLAHSACILLRIFGLCFSIMEVSCPWSSGGNHILKCRSAPDQITCRIPLYHTPTC